MLERGFYVPAFYDVQYAGDGTIAAFVPREGTGAPPVVRKAALKTTEAVDPPATTIFTPDTEFGSRFLVEVVRGCANLCRFCWAGYNYLPVRAFPKDRILQLAEQARPHSKRVGLVSIALCDHPEIEEILTRLVEMGYSISPASLRLDDITPPILRLLRQSGEKTITIAPETGSDRLRRVVNKTLTNDEILEAADMIFASGMENLKLYFMIGIPTETDDDLVAIRDLTLQLRETMMKHAKARGHIGRIVGSVNPLVPKPGTAYQWLPMEDDRSIERKIARMRSLMAGIDNVYFNIKSERHSFYQALLSLGDRRVAPAIEVAERNGGNWRAAVAEAGVDADFFVFRDRSHDSVLPWDIIDGGMKDSFFRAEARQSDASRMDAASETTERERASADGPSRDLLTRLRVALARVGISVGITALMVAAVIAITGGFVVDAGPLYLSAHRLLPPFVVAAAAYLLAFLQGHPSIVAADAALSAFVHRHALAIAIVLAAVAAGVGIAFGTYVVAASDPSAYISQARLIDQGRPRRGRAARVAGELADERVELRAAWLSRRASSRRDRPHVPSWSPVHHGHRVIRSR